MAIIVIPNQPVQIFLTDDFNAKNFECTQDNIDYCQQVEPGDTTMFQMRQTPVTGDNLLTGQPFDSVLTDWQAGPLGSWFHSSFGATTAFDVAVIFQGVTVTANTTYRIKYDVVNAINMHISVETNPVFGSVENYGTIATNTGEVGRFTAFARFSDDTPFNLGFRAHRDTPGGVHIIGIDNIELLELTEPVVTTRDSDGNTIETITDLQYYEDFVQAQVDWLGSTYSNGIYNICIGGVDDLDFNYMGNSLCLGLETGGELLQESGQCLKWF